MADFSAEAKEHVPEKRLNEVVQEMGRVEAIKFVESWLPWASGTCSLPRSDNATLILPECVKVPRV